MIKYRSIHTRKPARGQLNRDNPIVQKLGNGEIFSAFNRDPLVGACRHVTLTPANTSSTITDTKHGKGLLTTGASADCFEADNFSVDGWDRLSLLSVVYLNGYQSDDSNIFRETNATQNGIALSLPFDNSMRGLIYTTGTSFWSAGDDVSLSPSSAGWYVAAMTWDGATRRMYWGPLGSPVSELGSGQTVTGVIDIQSSTPPTFCLSGGKTGGAYGYAQPSILQVVAESHITEAEINAFSANPWALFEDEVYISTASAVGGFQAAWARNTNQIIGTHQ